jgi:selenocysteine-specific elongation factor
MRSIVVGTAGHIDHGKSTLIHALTGTDPDRLKEEKARGITIDLGFAHLVDRGVNFAFVDVPGHERFVKNMLAGAGGIDVVMLIVAADESVMPQTREHFQICRLLQVPAGLIVLTKIDAADHEMRELATLEVRELVAGSFLETAPIVPLSAKTGEGLADVRLALHQAAGRVPGRGSNGVTRLPVDRVFTVRGFGTVVTGTLASGTIRDEQVLDVLPGGRAVKVRGVQVHGQRRDRAAAGNRVAVNVAGVEVAELARGDTLAEPGTLEPTRRLDVLLEMLQDAQPLRHGTRVRFHQGTVEILGRVAIAAVGAAEIAPGGSGCARIRLEAPAVVTRGDRFIVRAYSPPVTIGGGTVLDPLPARSAIRTPAGLARLHRLAGPDDSAATAFVDERGAAGLPVAALVSRAGLSHESADVLADLLTTSGRAVRVGSLLVSPSVVDDLSSRLVAALEAHHAQEPLSEGLPREEARERIFGRAAPEVFTLVLDRLVAQGRVVARDRIALAGRGVSLSAEEARTHDALERIFADAGLAPPDVAAAARAAQTTGPVADRIVKLLLRERRLAKLDTLLFHVDALEALKRDVRALKTGGATPPRVDVAAFKERYGISRKYAIPLLEYLDRERVTRRIGDTRVLL